MRAACCLAGLILLAGCDNVAGNSAGPASGAAVGIGLGGITANPLIGYAAGIGTQAAVSALEKYLARKLHQGEQDRIAATVATLAPGQSAPWQIHYDIPIDAEHGDVTVTRLISNQLTTCKEVAFTIITAHARAIYITTACAQPDGTWKWAEAEPAAARWGFLQ